MRPHIALLLVGGCVTADLTDHTAADSAAVFTTLREGAAADVFASRPDVYLDENIAFPEGDYVFQVTDPSGRNALSVDDLACRRFHVDVGGRITAVLGGGCAHVWGNDLAQHGNQTIQLMPYDTTADGSYEVWVTPASAYERFGFDARLSETALFRVVGNGSNDCGC